MLCSRSVMRRLLMNWSICAPPFVGRRFRVRVGYRKTPGVKGSGKARDELANQRKPGDFLRVHDLLERLA